MIWLTSEISSMSFIGQILRLERLEEAMKGLLVYTLPPSRAAHAPEHKPPLLQGKAADLVKVVSE